MSVIPLRQSCTQDEFFAWAEAQEGRYEFDGVQPVAMPGATVAHALIAQNLYSAVERRLPEHGPCRVMGPNIGLATTGSAVRCPDAVICCSRQDLSSRLVVGARVVFEVLDESTAEIDRIWKVHEYAAVPTILRYVMIESTFMGAAVLARKGPGEIWGARTLSLEGTLRLPEVSIELPVAALYHGIAPRLRHTPGRGMSSGGAHSIVRPSIRG